MKIGDTAGRKGMREELAVISKCQEAKTLRAMDVSC